MEADGKACEKAAYKMGSNRRRHYNELEVCSEYVQVEMEELLLGGK